MRWQRRNQLWQRSVNKSVNQNPSLAAACLLTGILAAGCDLPARPLLGPADVRRPELGDSAADTKQQEVLEPPSELAESRWETWDAYFVRDQHVGYSHVRAESAGGSSSRDIR